MEGQGWKALGGNSPSKSQGASGGAANPFGGNGGGDYAVQSTYVPPTPAGDPHDPFAHMGMSSLPAPSYAPAAPSYAPEVVPAVIPHTSQGGGGASGSGPAVLQFQESHLPSYHVAGKMGPEVPKVQNYSQSTNLLGGGPPSAPVGGVDPDHALGGKFSVFNLKRYRRYFNVDTEEVLVRMRDSVFGAFKPNFLEKTNDNADLYGPFWIAATLVFLSAVAGNYASFVSYKRDHKGDTSSADAWYYDVDKVGYSAVLFYGYVGVVGLALWATLKWWFKSEVTLAQVWCTYGYALSLFIPVSIVCVLPYELLRWLLIAFATLASGLFLLLNFRRPIFDVAGAKAFPVWAAVGALHLGLGLALKLYFFQYWH